MLLLMTRTAPRVSRKQTNKGRAAFDDYKETCDDTAIGGCTRNGPVFNAGGRARNRPGFQ